MRPLTLEALVGEPPITGRGLRGVEWHPDGSRLTYLEKHGDGEDSWELWAFELETGGRERLLAPDSLHPGGEEPGPSLDGCRWLPDGERLLLAAKGSAWIYTLAEARLEPLIRDIDPQVRPHPSPSGDEVAFIRGGDLWVRSLDGDERALATGASKAVLNGKLDWVYWEELGHRHTWRAFEWSPDGSRIAFLRLDSSAVPRYPIVDALSVHPKLTRQRYPKAGDPNSLASVHVVEVSSGQVTALHEEPGDCFYVGPELAWAPDSTGIAWSRLARDQRSLELFIAAPAGAAPRLLLSESDPHWLNRIGPPHFLPDGSFLWISERTGRGHLYRHTPDGTRSEALTAGTWQVEQLYGTDAEHAYLTGTGEDARERHVYRVRLDGGGWERLTAPGGVCGANRRKTGGWMLVTRETPDQPPSSSLVHETGRRGVIVREPEPGWRDYDWPGHEFRDVEAPDGTILHGRLLFPTAFDPARRYPLLVHVYGGPHAQTVRKTWTGADPLEQLAAQAGILVWRLDNRGTWGRGHAFEAGIDRRLGALELEDQLAGVTFLKGIPYVDGDRIAIAGWSYGGYLTLYAMTKAPEVWRCGIAGAPVTDWKLYDSVYTERYMGTPSENAEGYQAASPLDAAGSLAAPLLLIHGTDDDNVHLQHTLQFVEALARHRKPYELLLQPGQKHGFTGVPARTYLHERMVEFLERHLCR